MLKHTKKRLLRSIFIGLIIQNNTIHSHKLIIPDKLTISMYQLLEVDCHNKLSDIQEQSYGISCILH